MSGRRDFLRRIFRELEDGKVDYCVMRNYDGMFAATESDVDLLARREDVEAAFQCLDRAAAAAGWRLVQKTRFVNHSLVFWNGEEEFLRLDLDTEVRWRIFQVLDAGEVLRTRIRREDFYIPSPKHEAAILLTQALWQGRLKDRYARQLEHLGFPAEMAQFRRKVLADAFRNPIEMVRHAWGDLRRLATRYTSPCGVSLRLVTARETTLEDLSRKLAVLFPPAKTTVFKGGLAMDVRRVDSDIGLAENCSNVAPGSRSFLCVEESDGKAHLIHVGSGDTQTATVPELAQFIPGILARQCARKRKPGRGLFVVLVGLDGSGKTTFARNLCGLIAASNRFRGARYFHWIPGLFGSSEFPLPAFAETERKNPVEKSLISTVLSLARLSKNLLKAHLSHWFRVRPLRRKGNVIIVDRFVYNYWLDPVSVKYAGPASWVAPMLKCFPRPDVLIALSADAETLLSRKRELTRAEIEAQSLRLRSLPDLSVHKMEFDSSTLADSLARSAFEKLEEVNHDRS